jgi:hypothetical protein
MCKKKLQLNKRQGCLLTGVGAAIEGGGSIRGNGTGGQKTMQQPAKHKRLNNRRSQWMGGYTTFSQIRVA